MYSDQMVYTGPAVVQSNATTAHSRQVHAREMSHLHAEAAVEGKRAVHEQELAYQEAARASMIKYLKEKEKKMNKKKKSNLKLAYNYRQALRQGNSQGNWMER